MLLLMSSEREEPYLDNIAIVSTTKAAVVKLVVHLKPEGQDVSGKDVRGCFDKRRLRDVGDHNLVRGDLLALGIEVQLVYEIIHVSVHLVEDQGVLFLAAGFLIQLIESYVKLPRLHVIAHIIIGVYRNGGKRIQGNEGIALIAHHIEV